MLLRFQNEEGSEEDDDDLPTNFEITIPVELPWLEHAFPFTPSVSRCAEVIRHSLHGYLPSGSVARRLSGMASSVVLSISTVRLKHTYKNNTTDMRLGCKLFHAYLLSIISSASIGIHPSARKTILIRSFALYMNKSTLTAKRSILTVSLCSSWSLPWVH